MLEGRNAIVTGSSRGIGKAIAMDLARNGANVVLNCRRNVRMAEQVALGVEAEGRKALVVQADISDESEAATVVRTCVEELGGVDVLVNNAGVMHRREIQSLDEGLLRATMEVDLLSCFYMSRHAVADMIDRGEGGSIVNVSSIIGMIGMSGATAYAAAKGGMNGLTVCLAREVARHGIRVNGVAPGYVETEMIEDWPKEHFEKIIPRIPMRRMARPEEVAELVTFLAGGCTYVTGQTVVVDGGIMID